MLLSICMMVKDEEVNLGRCLDSLKNILRELDSELIIVDTGSKDRTVEIAKKYTDRIYHHPWNNNFSEMRNISISYAEGEWLFILDADEEVRNDVGILDFFKLKKRNASFNTLCIALRNFTSTENMNIFSDLLTVRFFRNDGTFRYESLVHNIPIYKDPVGSLEGILYHYGYINDDPDLMEKKFVRTAQLLNEALEKDPDNVYYRYQLSVSLAMYQKWEDAENEALKAYGLFADSSIDEKDRYFYLYGHLMMIYKHFEQYERIINLTQEALTVRKDDIDSHFFMADALISRGSRKAAIPYLKAYLELVSKYEKHEFTINIDIKVETISYKNKALYNLLYIYFESQDYQEVLNVYTRYLDFVVNDASNEKMLALVIKAVLAQKSFKYLGELYKGAGAEFAALIERITESNMTLCDPATRQHIYRLFRKYPHNYGRLNRIREAFLEGTINLEDARKDLGLLNNVSEVYYADVFFEYYYRLNDYPAFVDWVVSHKLHDSLKMVDRLNHLFEHFEGWMLKSLVENPANTVEELTFRTTAEKYFLLAYAYEGRQAQVMALFKLFTYDRTELVRCIYLESVMDDESRWVEIDDEEARLVLYLARFWALDPCEGLHHLRNALRIAGDFKPYIAEMIQHIKSELDV